MCSMRRMAALVLLAAAIGAAADEIVLKNGDRIRGDVAAMAGGTLAVRTEYAGDIALRWSEVASLATTRPVEVLLKGARTPLRGTLQPLHGGRALLIDGGGSALELALSDVAFLNPKPWESGLGTAYEGRVTLSAAYARGNTEDERINGDGEFTARAQQYRYALSARIDRRDEAATGTTTAWRGRANYDRFLDERRFGYARGSLEHDRAKDIDRRAAAGFGYGVELIDTPRASLSVRAGLDYVAVDRLSAPNERYPALGWGLKTAYAPGRPGARVFHDNEAFWNLKDSDVLVVRSKTGLRLPLLEGLGATAQLNVDWERRPASGRKSTDSTLLFGIDYAW